MGRSPSVTSIVHPFYWIFFQIADDLKGGCASCLIIDQLGAVWVIAVVAVSDCEVIKRHAMGVTAPDCLSARYPTHGPRVGLPGGPISRLSPF
jgi:hypothetical protein